MKEILEVLRQNQDLKYRDFQIKLIPNINKESIIGVRTPILRKIAKSIYQENSYSDFLNELPHTYYEENFIHGYLIGQIKDYSKCIEALNKFLPYVDNWAICDTLSCKSFKKNLDLLIKDIVRYINSSDTYTIRFGVLQLMSYYLEENFKEEFLELVSNIYSEEYYVNMMLSWYFATALAKQYQSAIKYLEKKKLSKWVHNKTIRKAIESYRITDEQKEYLRSLIIK